MRYVSATRHRQVINVRIPELNGYLLYDSEYGSTVYYAWISTNRYVEGAVVHRLKRVK